MACFITWAILFKHCFLDICQCAFNEWGNKLKYTTVKGPDAAPMSSGHVYTFLSSTTSRSKIKLIIFEVKNIKYNHGGKK